MTITPDPKTVREIVLEYLRRYVTSIDHGDVVDEMLTDERFAHLMTGDEDQDIAMLDPIAADITEQAKALAGTLSWPDEQPQDERNPCGAQLPADSATRLGASPDTTCVRPDGHAAHDDGNGVLWTGKPRAAQDEQDGDARAVADFLASDKLGPAMAALHDHFAARIAELAEFAEEER